MQALKAYKAKNGHVNVRYKQNRSLYRFCLKLGKLGKSPGSAGLEERHIASLDALGFNWGFGNKSTDFFYNSMLSFEDRLEALKAYKATHGHLNVRKIHDRSLYKFCCRLKKSKKTLGKIALDEGYMASLDALGFNWGQAPDKGNGSATARSQKEEHRHRDVTHDGAGSAKRDEKTGRSGGDVPLSRSIGIETVEGINNDQDADNRLVSRVRAASGLSNTRAGDRAKCCGRVAMPAANTEEGTTATSGAKHQGRTNAGNRACMRSANNGARMEDGKSDVVGRVESDDNNCDTDDLAWPIVAGGLDEDNCDELPRLKDWWPDAVTSDGGHNDDHDTDARGLVWQVHSGDLGKEGAGNETGSSGRPELLAATAKGEAVQVTGAERKYHLIMERIANSTAADAKERVKERTTGGTAARLAQPSELRPRVSQVWQI